MVNAFPLEVLKRIAIMLEPPHLKTVRFGGMDA